MYWALMMLALLASFGYLTISLKRRCQTLFIKSLIQCVLAVTLPLFHWMVAKANHDFGYLWELVHHGEGSAFLIMLGYLSYFTLVIVNAKHIRELNHSVVHC